MKKIILFCNLTLLISIIVVSCIVFNKSSNRPYQYHTDIEASNKEGLKSQFNYFYSKVGNEDCFLSPLCIQNSILELNNYNMVSDISCIEFLDNGYMSESLTKESISDDLFTTYIIGRDVALDAYAISNVLEKNLGCNTMGYLDIDDFEEGSAKNVISVCNIPFKLGCKAVSSGSSILVSGIERKKTLIYDSYKIALDNDDYDLYVYKSFDGNGVAKCLKDGVNLDNYLPTKDVVELPSHTWLSIGKPTKFLTSFSDDYNNLVAISKFGFNNEDYEERVTEVDEVVDLTSNIGFMVYNNKKGLPILLGYLPREM